MQNYLVVHYGSFEPTFVYTETLDDARARALTILASQPNNSSDILSIVDITSDRIIYYGKGEKLAAQLNAANRPARTIWHSLLRSLPNWMSLQLSKLTV